MKKLGMKYWYLRLLAAGAMVMVFVAIISMSFFVIQRLHKTDKETVLKGYARIQLETIEEIPIYLNGEWEQVDGDEAYKRFPVGSIVDAYEDATYRMYFSIDKLPEEKIAFAIPTFDGEIKVTLNGIEQKKIDGNEKWIRSDALDSLTLLDDIDMSKEWQELTITGEFSRQDITLYRRPVILGTLQNILTLVMFDSANEMFVLGILILVLVNGFVFMLFRPNHLVISLITLFDTAIMIRVFFSMNYVVSMLQSFLPGFRLSDRFSRAGEISALMLGGLLGCVLSTILFDPERKTPKWLVTPIPIIYFIYMLIFPGNLAFFEQYGSHILNATYIFTFIGVFYEFTICWKKGEKRGYFLFQFFKTSYIGLVIFADILLWTRYMNFAIMIYFYIIFFIFHVVIKLYDNNQSYSGVEILNQSLEATVKERTLELYQANQILSEISVRDPLTKVFNRFYFEKIFEKMMDELQPEDSLYICIMDLDHFKNVNDTYGHDVGDEVLRKAAEIVGKHISEDTILARIGGEEFVLICSQMSQEEAMNSINRIRELLEENAKNNPQHTTASFGVAGLSAEDTKKTLLKKADLALYKAKEKGRNCVELWKDSYAQESQ